MEKYKNLSKDSGVLAYETGEDYILVRFSESFKVYKYSYLSAGKKHVEQMKKIARSGRGLSTYISRYVKDLFED